jgi:hypothetical protein
MIPFGTRRFFFKNRDRLFDGAIASSFLATILASGLSRKPISSNFTASTGLDGHSPSPRPPRISCVAAEIDHGEDEMSVKTDIPALRRRHSMSRQQFGRP